MSSWRRIWIAGCCLALSGAWPAHAAEPVGQATLIKTEVTGQGGPIVINDEVHRDERIRTSQSGLGQFIFRDGTKLAVGWGSSVVIDKYVFDDSDSVKRLSIKAAKGTFRWVSGNSKSSAYQIQTPAGTIGVRGTAFDFYVGPDGTTAVVLLNGAASFCGPGGCRQLQQRCDCVIARPNGNMTDTQPVNNSVLQRLGNQRALPFLSGNQSLTGGLGLLGGCRMASVQPERKDRVRPAPPPRRDPDVPSPRQPQKQDDPQKQPPEKPHHDKPHHDKPKGGWHDKHDRYGWKDKHDRNDRHSGHGRPDRQQESDHSDRHDAPDRPSPTERAGNHQDRSHHDSPSRQERSGGASQTASGGGSAGRDGKRDGSHDRNQGRDHDWGGNGGRNGGWNRNR